MFDFASPEKIQEILDRKDNNLNVFDTPKEPVMRKLVTSSNKKKSGWFKSLKNKTRVRLYEYLVLSVDIKEPLGVQGIRERGSGSISVASFFTLFDRIVERQRAINNPRRNIIEIVSCETGTVRTKYILTKYGRKVVFRILKLGLNPKPSSLSK
jgi:hypothetical protein